MALGRGAQTPTRSSGTAWWPFTERVARSEFPEGQPRAHTREQGVRGGPVGLWQKHMAVRAQGGGDRDRAAVLVPRSRWAYLVVRCSRGERSRPGPAVVCPLRSLPGQGDAIAAFGLAGAGGQPP